MSTATAPRGVPNPFAAGRAAASRPERADGTSEMSSLSERMTHLQVLRVAIGIVAVVAGLLAGGVAEVSGGELLWATACYLLLTAAMEGARRLTGRGLAIVAGMLLIDGIYLAWAMHVTGDAASPLRFLVYLHLIAVSLLGSYRTGLKIALWHSLLFFVVYYAIAAELLDSSQPAGVAAETPVLTIMAFWIVAIGTAAFSAVNERGLRRSKRDLEDLAAMASSIERRADAHGVGTSLLEAVADTFGVRRGVVLASAEGTSDLEIVARLGPGSDYDARAGVDRIVATAWGRRAPELVKRVDPETSPRLAALIPGGRNVVVVPLFADGDPIGAVALEFGVENERIERRVITMLAQFCAHSALALRNVWLLEKVQMLALTDGLTGIANRRAFEDALERELARARRSGESVALLMLDIDHFKSLNDALGHRAGDEVLVGVARILQSQSREYDVVARYGGEEFAVIFSQATTDDPMPVAERLRRSIAEVPAPVPVTASGGVALFPANASDADALVRAADAAMYESKRRGRDRLTKSRRQAKPPA